MNSELAITPDEMREIEERSERLGVSRLLLMENAGKAVADFLVRRVGAAGKNVVVVAGTGNNGGDGFVAARHMASYGASVEVFLLGSEGDIRTPEASRNWQILQKISAVKVVKFPDRAFTEKLRLALRDADIVVDAIFGTGIKGELGEPHASVIDAVNAARGFKVAVDVPSGLDPLTGETRGRVVKADATVTFHRIKKGLLGRGDVVGELVVADIGVPPGADRDLDEHRSGSPR